MNLKYLIPILAVWTSYSFAQAGVNQLAQVSSAKISARPALNGNLKGDLTALAAQSEYYTITNMFLKDKNKVLSLDGKNRMMMATYNEKDDRQKWYFVTAPNGYVQMKNESQGAEKCVDSDAKKPDIRKCGPYSGQAWLFTQENNWVRISNSYQKADRVLDTANAKGNYVFFQSKSKDTSGTYWALTLVKPDQPTFKSLSDVRAGQ